MKKIHIFISLLFLGGILGIVLGCLADVSRTAPVAAKLLSHDGVLIGKTLYKLKLIPWMLILCGLEMLIVSVLLFLKRNGVRRWATSFRLKTSMPKMVAFGLLTCYFLFSIVVLNFLIVTGGADFFRYKGLSYMEKIEKGFIDSGYRDSFKVVKASLGQIPEDAGILLICESDVKYIINYYLYPRKIYEYPTENVGLTEVPTAWLQDKKIRYVVEVKGGDIQPNRMDSDSTRFIIKRLSY